MSVSEQKPPTPSEQLAKFKRESAKPSIEPGEVPEVAEAPQKLVVKALHDFNVCMNGQLIQFKKDQLITDSLTAKFLVEQNMPIKSVEDKKEYFFCKHCSQPNTL